MSWRMQGLRNLLEWFGKAFHEPHGGGPSAMRLAAFFVVGNVMLVWSYICITSGKWTSMGWDMIVMVLSVLGVKAWQRKHENTRPPQPPQPRNQEEDQ